MSVLYSGPELIVESNMPIDSALLASLEGPSPLETYSKAVEKNPEDFDSWTKLLALMDDQVGLAYSSRCVGYRHDEKVL